MESALRILLILFQLFSREFHFWNPAMPSIALRPMTIPLSGLLPRLAFPRNAVFAFCSPKFVRHLFAFFKCFVFNGFPFPAPEKRRKSECRLVGANKKRSTSGACQFGRKIPFPTCNSFAIAEFFPFCLQHFTNFFRILLTRQQLPAKFNSAAKFQTGNRTEQAARWDSLEIA